MKDGKIITEAIMYERHFADSKLKILIDISNEIANRDLALRGLFQDIHLVVSGGISVIITHDIPKINIKLKELGIMSGNFVPQDRFCLDESDYQQVRDMLGEGLVPIFFCAQLGAIARQRIAANIGLELGVKKLIYVVEPRGIFYPGRRSVVSDITIDECRVRVADGIIKKGKMRNIAEAAIETCSQKIKIDRVHIISGFSDGALLRELYTSQGHGTMIHKSSYRSNHRANDGDIQAIAGLLENLVKEGVLSLSKDIARHVNDFEVFTIDGEVHGCMMISEDQAKQSMSVKYLMVSHEYDESDLVERMVNYAVVEAERRSSRCLMLEKDNCHFWLALNPWFFKLGFVKTKLSSVPAYCDTSKSDRMLWMKELKK